ncbi:proprotein convertase P-domain-containing protein [Sphingomonas sp.]|uniref:proprotein convertase P-domain-containing protein n=1 Tax=Sphingomonas sp. TaxID=28214 RepID=UPI0025DE924A|nr:proprotein convertase P-domain-containing protein [Sphingomonas sp.]
MTRIAVVLTRVALLLWLVSGIVAPAAAQTSVTNSTDGAVAYVSSANCPGSAFKRTFSVSQSLTVADVNIGVLMAHDNRPDLRMYLVGPDGTRVQLAANNGNAANHNVNVLFDDEAANAISSYTTDPAAATSTTVVPPYAASYRPTQALSAFDGKAAQGIWTLEICDTNNNSINGTFYQADLTITGAAAADLSLTMSVSPSSPVAGATVTYTLTVTNASASSLTANGVVVGVNLPTGVSYSGSTATGTSYDPTTDNWTVGTLAPGQSRTLTITAQVIASSGATLTATAEVLASSATDSDSTPGNGSTSEDDYASASATVSGTRTAGTAPTLVCPAGSASFSWNNYSWAAGSTSNSYALAGIGTLSFTLSNPGQFLNNATYGGQSPTRQNVVTGGLATARYSLMELVDLANQTQEATTTISLGVALPGVQFTIFDVDYGTSQFADKVTITGTRNGVTVYPTLTNGLANYVSGNVAYGDQLSGDTQANGNVVVTFSAPVDTIVLRYGNHSLAPTDPGQQGIAISDFTLCKAESRIAVSKSSTVLSDPVNGATNPKAIPGAVAQYCILVSNAGYTTATNVTASDPLPAGVAYVAGSIRSGTSCSDAATTEDDDAAGADETDPFGASLSGTTVTGTAGSLAPGASFAFTLRTTIK